MKTFPLSLALGALISVSGMATAGSGSLGDFIPKVLPVLVQVDSHGKVTGASPATQLSPRLNRLLRANLDEMISSPALDKKGRPRSSQFVMNLALHTSPRPDGDYDLKFAYISTSPVPAGSWYWVHKDGRELALASQSARNRVDFMPGQPAQPNPWGDYGRSSMPTISNTGSPTPTAVLPSGPTQARDPGNGH